MLLCLQSARIAISCWMMLKSSPSVCGEEQTDVYNMCAGRGGGLRYECMLGRVEGYGTNVCWEGWRDTVRMCAYGGGGVRVYMCGEGSRKLGLGVCVLGKKREGGEGERGGYSVHMCVVFIFHKLQVACLVLT